MTHPATEGQATSLRAAPAAGRALAPSPAELERLERELRADPCNLVRRACQLADYEDIAPGGGPDETQSR